MILNVKLLNNQLSFIEALKTTIIKILYIWVFILYNLVNEVLPFWSNRYVERLFHVIFWKYFLLENPFAGRRFEPRFCTIHFTITVLILQYQLVTCFCIPVHHKSILHGDRSIFLKKRLSFFLKAVKIQLHPK